MPGSYCVLKIVARKLEIAVPPGSRYDSLLITSIIAHLLCGYCSILWSSIPSESDRRFGRFPRRLIHRKLESSLCMPSVIDREFPDLPLRLAVGVHSVLFFSETVTLMKHGLLAGPRNDGR